LKPANVLLDDRFEPKIDDFGLSKFVAPGQTLYQSISCGSAKFMAPEVHEDVKFGFKADVYAFGILMYMVVTGLEPFLDAKNQFTVARKVTSGERPPITNSISPALSDLIQRCWDTNPNLRPQFNDIVLRLGEDAFLDNIDLEIFTEYQSRVVPSNLIALPPLELLEKMADDGDPFAQIQFGKHLQKDDVIRAAFYFKRAADSGNPTGMVEYGKCLIGGIGVTQDSKAGVNLYRRACDLGDAEAQYQLGLLLRNGSDVCRDEREALRLFKMSADAGHALAMTEYGDMLEHGYGIAVNIPEAVKYYRMSSDQACPAGMYNLADMYQHGRHVKHDIRDFRGKVNLPG
jgi:hypothetical protein